MQLPWSRAKGYKPPKPVRTRIQLDRAAAVAELLFTAVVAWLVTAAGITAAFAAVDWLIGEDSVAYRWLPALLIAAPLVPYLTWLDCAEKSYVQYHVTEDGQLVGVDMERLIHETDLVDDVLYIESSAPGWYFRVADRDC